MAERNTNRTDLPAHFSGEVLRAQHLPRWLSPRAANAHKGDMGKLVIIAGDTGTAGAARLCGEGALRSGAGLVRVLTHQSNIIPLLAGRPELMTHQLSSKRLDISLQWADVIAIGPGLGTRQWGKSALSQVKKSKKVMVWDADALNMLAIDPDKRQNRILTPHAGEAARLLGTTPNEIENNRPQAARLLAERYGGVAVLKGAGTLIASDAGQMAIAHVGNPGMATGGMGDVLTGVISALLAQKMTLWDAACAGVVAHGAAADTNARALGMCGMLAMDVAQQIRTTLNPDITN